MDRLTEELAHISDKNFDTLYIGGGTPSLIPNRTLENFLKKLFKSINYNGIEFTFEINPDSADKDKLKILYDFGLTRASIGAQSFDEEILKYLGRIHNVNDIYTVFRHIRNINSNISINMDIIFDIPGKKTKINKTVDELLGMAPEHISTYSFSYDTKHFRNKSTKEQSPKEYIFINNKLTQNGYQQYEISNYAKTGHDSKHNKIYWNMNEYIGLGTSAHSMIYNCNGERIRYSNNASIEEYLKGNYQKETETVKGEELLKEDLIFGLRQTEGVDACLLAKKYGKNYKKCIDHLRPLFEDNLLNYNGERICTSQKGLLIMDSLQQYIWELQF
jgi:oxygen-independent coproporphyrinogen-3 oxidase